MQERFSHTFDPSLGCLRLSGVLPRDVDDGTLRRTLLLGLIAVPRELVVDLSEVELIPAVARRELEFLLLAADHFNRVVRFVTRPSTAASLVLPILGMAVEVWPAGWAGPADLGELLTPLPALALAAEPAAT